VASLALTGALAGCGGGGHVATSKTKSSVPLDLPGGVAIVVLCRKPVTTACRRERDRIETLDRTDY